MTKNEVIEMDKRVRERLRTILKALDGLSVMGALNLLELTKQTLLADTVCLMSESVDKTIAELVGEVKWTRR